LGHTEAVPAAALFIQIGAEPNTAWLPPEIRRDAWGYLSGRDLCAGSWPLERSPLILETSLPRGVASRAHGREAVLRPDSRRASDMPYKEP